MGCELKGNIKCIMCRQITAAIVELFQWRRSHSDALLIRGGLVTTLIESAHTLNTIGATLQRCKVQIQNCNLSVIEAIIERVLAESGTASDPNCGWKSRPSGLHKVIHDEAEHNTSNNGCMQ
jgi:hypothetical protein